VGIRRTEGSFEGVGGVSLFRRGWVPEAPERLVVLVHGFAEHSGRYEELGAWFADRGCAVHAFDLRGHGRSHGRRNHVDRFDDFLDDTGRFLSLARAEHEDLPAFLVGHSMGGLIATAFVCERAPDLVALVTSGAALAPTSVSRGKVLAARLLRKVAPRLTLDSDLPATGLSHDPEVVRRYLADPLIGSKMTVSLGAEMLDAVERTAKSGASVRVPMLLLHGGADPLCAPGGSEAFHASLAPDIGARSGLHVHPELLHEIFNERERYEIFAEVLAFIRAREAEDRRPGGGPGTAADAASEPGGRPGG